MSGLLLAVTSERLVVVIGSSILAHFALIKITMLSCLCVIEDNVTNHSIVIGNHNNNTY